MGVLKDKAIAAARDERHSWQFVATPCESLRSRIDRVELLNEFVMEFARTLDSADHAVDAIDSPHDWVEEIAAFISENDFVESSTIARLGLWECDDCGKQSNRMTFTIQEQRDCAAS
jgi:hypothetical protein